MLGPQNRVYLFFDDEPRNEASGAAPFVITLGDAGTAAEALAIAAQLTGADTGAGAETPEIAAHLTGVDTGTGNETPGVGAEVPASDTGTALDVISAVRALLEQTDSGSGVDALTALRVDVSAVDSGSALDAIVGVGVQVTGADTGSALDTIASLAAQIDLTDTGAALDQLTLLRVRAALADSATSSEAMALNWRVTIFELGSGVESLVASALVRPADTGAATELPDIGVDTESDETGSGAETSVIQVLLQLGDAASALDAILTITRQPAVGLCPLLPENPGGRPFVCQPRPGEFRPDTDVDGPSVDPHPFAAPGGRDNSRAPAESDGVPADRHAQAVQPHPGFERPFVAEGGSGSGRPFQQQPSAGAQRPFATPEEAAESAARALLRQPRPGIVRKPVEPEE